jgi:hypothetical protein
MKNRMSLKMNQTFKFTFILILFFVYCKKPVGTKLSNFEIIKDSIKATNKNQLDSFTKIDLALSEIKISRNDLASTYFSVDTLYYSISSNKADLIYNRILGINKKYYKSQPTISPATHNSILNQIFELNDSIVLIPFHPNRDNEETFYTKWKLRGADSLIYVSYLKEPVNSKYSIISLLKVIESNGKRFILGDNSGGEGGEWGHMIWVGKLIGEDNFSILKEYEVVNYHEDTIASMLNYQVLKDRILILEEKDSLVYQNDTILEFRIEEKLFDEFLFNEEQKK